MSLDIIANVDRLQTRIAIMQDGKLLELKYEGEEDVVGNIYLARVTDAVAGLDACFVDAGIERNAFMHVSDALPEEPPRGARHSGNLPRIQDVVKKGDVFLVQVTKGPLETKGARATRHISLPGRYLVLTTQDNKVGVSKKIEDDAERKRLRDLAAKLRPEGFGLIVRTRAEEARAEDFERDIRFLTKVWRSIESKAAQSKAPALIHADLSLVFEVVRDIFSEDIDNFYIDDKVTYDQALNLVGNTAPPLRGKIKLYREPEPIFAHFGVDEEIARALRSKIMLPHGGHLNIEGTTALTTIDVNTGKFTGTSSLEKTVLVTNLDACQEIARQLRLRDIGGIIVIDFIDMDNATHRKQVMTALRQAFAEDRMRTRIMHITRLGLVEMTRKRTGVSLTERLLTPCPCCAGSGKILDAETVARRALNEIRQYALEKPKQAIHVLLDPLCALALIGPQGEEAEALENEVGVPVYVRATRAIHPESYEIEQGPQEEFRKRFMSFRAEAVLEVTPEQILRGQQHPDLRALVEGCVLEVPELSSSVSEPVQVRLTKVSNSYLRGTPLGHETSSAAEAGTKAPAKRRRRRSSKSTAQQEGRDSSAEAQPTTASPDKPATESQGKPQPVSPLKRLLTLTRRKKTEAEVPTEPPPTSQPKAAETSAETPADSPPKKKRRRGSRGRGRSKKAASAASDNAGKTPEQGGVKDE
ncbi:MAG: Rne/Rng family ribonuclease [candidate division WS1 bacterium]|nr:Rne/Rng family ribonuclease [candidate division WS1 bacterium]